MRFEREVHRERDERILAAPEDLGRVRGSRDGHVARSHAEDPGLLAGGQPPGLALAEHHAADGELVAGGDDARGRRGAHKLRGALVPEDGAHRLLDVEGAGLAVQAPAAPVVEAVRRVGVLLDLQDQVPGVDRVDLAAADEDRVAGRDRHLVDADLGRVLRKGLREGLARHAGL